MWMNDELDGVSWRSWVKILEDVAELMRIDPDVEASEQEAHQ